MTSNIFPLTLDKISPFLTKKSRNQLLIHTKRTLLPERKKINYLPVEKRQSLSWENFSHLQKSHILVTCYFLLDKGILHAQKLSCLSGFLIFCMDLIG